MKLLLLAGNTLRSRAYTHALSTLTDITVFGLFYGFHERKIVNPKLDITTETNLHDLRLKIPDMSTPITDVFEQKGWSFEFINTLDVNSNLIIDRINQLKFDFVIFSGYGGQILKQNHFETNMPYLHMHPGSLPEERGSTTIYYSILNQKKCTVTAFLMTDQIDSGKIILKHEYEIPPRGTNIDTWFDNIVRADCLCRAVHILKTNHLLKFDNKNGNTVSEEYYIIHPVLKHIALLSM